MNVGSHCQLLLYYGTIYNNKEIIEYWEIANNLNETRKIEEIKYLSLLIGIKSNTDEMY